MISVYHNNYDTGLTNKKQENIERYNKLLTWGRKNPIGFCEKILRIQLLDYQRYVLAGTWTAQYAAWVCSRSAGKSFLGAVYFMLRAILFPSMKICILSNSAKQANETFKKLEDIAKHNLSSLVGSSDVFYNEVVKNNADSDGFTHGQKGYQCSLYNGTTIKTIVGRDDTVVGERSNLNFYDEAGKIGPKFFALTKPFCTTEKNFKLGGGIDSTIFPDDVPNQIIYASSAEDIQSELFMSFKEWSINMIIGKPGYFVADISCEMPLHPTVNGKEIRPLLTQEKIDDDMKLNEVKARREYYNIFDRTGGTDAIVKRGDITRNTSDYMLPEFKCQGREHHHVLCFDPALQADNSFMLIGEAVWNKEKKQWDGYILNGVNLVEKLKDGTKKPLRTEEQLEWIRKIIVAYNGYGDSAVNYDNLDLLIDAGSGGGGRTYSERLWEDWVDKNGKTHRGLYDKNDEDSARVVPIKHPHALPAQHLIEPRKYRNDMFEALSLLITNDQIKFPMELPRDGMVTTVLKDSDGEEVTSRRKLHPEEIRALAEIDLMREEICLFIKEKNPISGTVSYHLQKDVERKMHDDRAYTLAMFCWWISELNRKERAKTAARKINFGSYFGNAPAISPTKPRKDIPFQGASNPFGKRR